jgi:putative sigma-54 modulation protein
MNVIVAGKNIEVTDALRRYAERKLQKITKYFHQIQEAHVVLKVERQRPLGPAEVVEVTVRGDGLILRGEEATTDMYASIDGVVEKLEKQLAKFRSRMIEKRRLDESRRRSRTRNRSKSASIEEVPTIAGAEALPQDVVRIKRFALKPMGIEEAVMQMELLSHDFFVFRNARTGEVNVVYKRRDGKYGLIEPEG